MSRLLALPGALKLTKSVVGNTQVVVKPGTFGFRLGQNERAIEDYDRAIEHNSEYSTAYNNRGIAFYDLGNTQVVVKPGTFGFRLVRRHRSPHAQFGPWAPGTTRSDWPWGLGRHTPSFALVLREKHGPNHLFSMPQRQKPSITFPTHELAESHRAKKLECWPGGAEKSTAGAVFVSISVHRGE